MEGWPLLGLGLACCGVGGTCLVSLILPSQSLPPSPSDPDYADKLLKHARQLHDLAYSQQSSFTVSDPFYKSWGGFQDELAWASAWLYAATGEQQYLDKAKEKYWECCSNTNGGGFSWDNKGKQASTTQTAATAVASQGVECGRLSCCRGGMYVMWVPSLPLRPRCAAPPLQADQGPDVC